MVQSPYRITDTRLHIGKTMNRNNIPDNLYRIWHDPFALNKETDEIKAGDSLGSFFVYERNNNFTPGGGDRIVAWFTGRPSTTDAFNEIMFKAADYYNAVIQFENDRGDVYNYAKTHNRLHQLADEPEIRWKKAIQGKKSGRKKGISINTQRKYDGVIYLRDWLITRRGKGEIDGNLLNLHYVYDEAFLKELLRFKLDKGNFDRVSTGIVGQYDTKELFHVEIRKPVVHQDTTNIFNRELF